VSLSKPAARRVKPPLYRRRIRQLFEHARQSPGLAVSALDYRSEQGVEMDPPIWLSCVLSESIRRKSLKQGFDFEFIRHECNDGFTGNLRVNDLRIVYRNSPGG
jgi:hypothetical protein